MCLYAIRVSERFYNFLLALSDVNIIDNVLKSSTLVSAVQYTAVTKVYKRFCRKQRILSNLFLKFVAYVVCYHSVYCIASNPFTRRDDSTTIRSILLFNGIIVWIGLHRKFSEKINLLLDPEYT